MSDASEVIVRSVLKCTLGIKNGSRLFGVVFVFCSDVYVSAACAVGYVANC